MNPETNPAPDPTINTAATPPPGPDPLAPPPKNKRTKLFIALGAAVIIIVFALIGFALVSGDPSDPGNNDKKGANNSAFPNLLKPASTIKVGDHRYVAPCSALSLSDVKKQFGGQGGDGYVMEQFADSSLPPVDIIAYDSSCVYYLKSGKDIDQVSVNIAQHTNVLDAKDLRKSLPYNAKDMTEKVATFKDAAGNNSKAKELASRMESSLSVFKQYSEIYWDKEELKKLKHDGVILPGFTNVIHMFYGNSVYNVEIPGLRSKEPTAEAMSAVYRTLQVVEKNIKNKNLDQAPIPTILGKSDKVGSKTKIIESCTVLTKPLFEQITGRQQNQMVRRTTMPVDAQKVRYGTRDKEKGLPDNDCRRSNVTISGEGFGSSSDSMTVTLTIKHGKSAKEADEWLKAGPGTVPLQTDAEKAYYFATTDPIGPSVYYFKVGPYANIVSILHSNSGGLGGKSKQNYASEQEYVKAINLIVAKLKEQI